MKSYCSTSLTTRMAGACLPSSNLSTYSSSCSTPSWRLDCPPLLGLHDKVLVAGGLDSVRKQQELAPPWHTASSSRLQWAHCWPKLSQQFWWCLWDNVFRKGWKMLHSSCEGEEWENRREAVPTDIQSVREGEEVLHAQEQRFSCSLWKRLWWPRLCPCSPCRTMVEQISTL